MLQVDKLAGKEIRRYVADADLLGLIAAGCPRDEYGEEADILVREIRMLADIFGECVVREDIHRMVVNVFGSQFSGTHWSPHATAELVDSICSRLCVADGESHGLVAAPNR